MTVDWQSEFSRRIRIDDLRPAGETVQIDADADERAALTKRFGILALDRLRARVALTPRESGAIVDAEIHMIASAVQACVVTLEPVGEDIDVVFTRSFRPHAAPLDTDAGSEVFLALDEEDPPEPLPSGSVDIGEVMAEQLALELAPFPRAAGVAFSGYTTGSADVARDTPGSGPFNALAEWQRKRGSRG